MLPSACQVMLVTIRDRDSRKGEPVGVGVGWGDHRGTQGFGSIPRHTELWGSAVAPAPVPQCYPNLTITALPTCAPILPTLPGSHLGHGLASHLFALGLAGQMLLLRPSHDHQFSVSVSTSDSWETSLRKLREPPGMGEGSSPHRPSRHSSVIPVADEAARPRPQHTGPTYWRCGC